MSQQKSLLFAFLILSISYCSNLVEGQSSIKTSANYVAESLVSHGTVKAPRGLTQDDSGDILVVAQGTSQVQAIFQDGEAIKTAVVVPGDRSNLNHGVFYHEGYIYASNTSSVLRWKYSSGQRSRVTTEAEVVVKEIPAGGDHFTRTIIIDNLEFLYVTVGSESNVDDNSDRALIRRFNLAEGVPTGGFTFQTGELFVNGVRNVVGLAIDSKSNIWGVDCGADELYREDLGGDIHNTNPADKLIRFSPNSSYYGYPYCWTVDKLSDFPKGQQRAWPTFMNDGVHSDAWCQNEENVSPPTLSLPAHNAALGLAIYDGVSCNTSTDSFLCSMKGDIFVALHGSKNREPPSGYKVVRILMDPNTNLPTGEIQTIVYETNVNTCVTQANDCFRPVDLVFDKNGHLIVTSDTSSEVIRIRYKISNNSRPEVEEKRFLVLGILGVVFIALFTGVIIGMIASRYCFVCRPSKEIPYQREDI